MPLSTHVTSHVHTDGPIPGPHSLLTVTSHAYDRDGDLIGTFTTNVRELPGATLHPVALQQWRRRAEDWLSTRRGSRPPAVAMAVYSRWLEQLPGEKVFVADPSRPDYLFLYWYFQRFVGHWPFARTSTEPGLHDRLVPTPDCRLAGCWDTRMELARTS
jgi:hypothetical protein